MIMFPVVFAALLAVQPPAPFQSPSPSPSPSSSPSPSPQRPSAGRFETDRTIAVPKGTRITLSSDGGDIVVHTWDRDAVRVRASHSSRMTVTAELKDQVLVISADSARKGTSVDYDLTVPSSVSLRLDSRFSDIDVDGVSGAISVESVEGNLTLRNVSGAVTAKTIHGKIDVAGGRSKIQLTTIEGDIVLAKASGDIIVDTNEGDVSLTDVQGPSISVSTVDGDIHYVGALQASAQYEFTTHDGDILMNIPENSSATFGVRTYSDENSVHTSFSLKPVGTVRKGRRVTYTMGSGAAQVEIETFEGSFYLRKPGETTKKDE